MQGNYDETNACVGTTNYLYGEGNYKKFVDSACKYVSKIFDANAIVNQKCNINNILILKFINILFIIFKKLN